MSTSSRSIPIYILTQDDVYHFLIQGGPGPRNLTAPRMLRYTQSDLDSALNILGMFDLRVSDEVAGFVEAFYETIHPGLWTTVFGANQLQENRNRKKLSAWFAEIFDGFTRAGRSIKTRSQQDITASITHRLLKHVVEKINKVDEIIQMWGGGYTAKQREYLVTYRGLYDAIFVYLLDNFFQKKFLIRSEMPPSTQTLHAQIMRELYLRQVLPNEPGANALQQRDIPNLATLEDAARLSIIRRMPNAPLRGGKRSLFETTKK